MKQQIKLTESELKMVIEGAVRNLLKEYDPHMAGRGAARGLERGNIKPWNAAQKIARRDGWDEDQLMAFQNGFERKPVQQSGSELEEEDFNEQPTNDVVGENKRPLKITENQLFSIIKESVNKILNEIGDTPRGNFALNAVRGRRAAKRYRTNMGANAEAENNKVMGMASDTMYRNYEKNPKLGYNNEAGYRYGFDKGVEKYEKSN